MISDAERWSWVFLTLVALACIWLLFRRAQLIITRAENTEDRADQILDRCDEFTEWLWEAHRQQPPPTEPQPIAAPATVPESEAVGRIADVELAWEFARIEDILHRPVKPSPRPRSKRAAA